MARWLQQTIDDYKERQADKYMNKIKGALERMNHLQVYNPYKAGLPSSLSLENRFTKELTESYVWYQGVEQALSDFYRGATGQTSNEREASYFWAKSPDDGKVRRVHSGLPKHISDTMATVLFGNGYKVDVTSYTDIATKAIDTAKTEQLTELINLLASSQGINISSLLEQSGSVESWAGDVAWKIAIDVNVSPYPILIACDPRSYEPIVIKGVTIGIKFKDYKDIKKGNETVHYEIHETYTTDVNDGTSLIIYSAEMIRNSKDYDVRLAEVPDDDIQAMLQQPGVIVSDDGLTATIRFEGLKGILAWHKPNKVNKSYGYNAIYGENDHIGNFTNYDSLDEALSVLIDEARTNKTKRYIPDTMLKHDQYGKVEKFDEFVNNYVITTGTGDAQKSEKIDITQIADKTADHLKKYETFLGLACACAKISPLTLGITNTVSLANGDKTLQERSKTTAETRKIKLSLWSPFLEQVFYKLVEVYWFMWETYPIVRQRAAFEAIQATEKDTTINVSFPDYHEMGVLDRATLWSDIRVKGGISIEHYVDMVYGDTMTAEAKATEVSNIKIESNVGLNNPDLLNPNDIGV